MSEESEREAKKVHSSEKRASGKRREERSLFSEFGFGPSHSLSPVPTRSLAVFFDPFSHCPGAWNRLGAVTLTHRG